MSFSGPPSSLESSLLLPRTKSSKSKFPLRFQVILEQHSLSARDKTLKHCTFTLHTFCRFSRITLCPYLGLLLQSLLYTSKPNYCSAIYFKLVGFQNSTDKFSYGSTFVFSLLYFLGNRIR